MESFGLFNFLKSAFFPSSSAESGEGTSPLDAAAFLKNIFPSPQAEKKSEPSRDSGVAPPQKETPAPASAAFSAPQANSENNPFLALMERHERLAKNIDRKAPRR
ncbi:MAG: hypothetical protein HPZ86_00805 [Clostridia bacterium]|nr:hypothetical protein [Clostridia bacterium]